MHRPVLLQQSVEALNLKPGKIFLDGTFGGGGHSKEVLRQFGRKVRVIGLDQDPDVIMRLGNTLNIELVNENFRNLDKALKHLDIEEVDAILFDLGISSDQLEGDVGQGRGFSFQKDEPLDMRMSKKGITAKDILNSWDEKALELILRGFGEEKASRKIAQAIVKRRKNKPFENTSELVDTILEVKKNRYGKINPATQTFQALRIAVNEELTALEIGLEKGFKFLNRGGRFAVISFHSLEDRIVKNFFRDLAKRGLARLITKKPIIPDESEIKSNPRSRSSRLRIIEKI